MDLDACAVYRGAVGTKLVCCLNYCLLIYPPCNSALVLLLLFMKELIVMKVFSFKLSEIFLVPSPQSTTFHHLLSQAGLVWTLVKGVSYRLGMPEIFCTMPTKFLSLIMS